MTDVAINPPVAERTPEQTERVAWSVLLLAFACFCAIFLASAIGIYYFLFQSTVSMDTELTVGRGTAIVRGADLDERPEQGRRTSFDRLSTIRTDSVGQATLTFYDQQSDTPAIASLTMNSSTSLMMEEFTRPRFEWSTSNYVIRLGQFSGRLDINTSDSSLPLVEMVITTTDGTQIQLLEGGRYSITANNVQVRVETFSGSARFTAVGYEQTLNAGERVWYNLNSHELVPLSPYVQLVATDSFNATNVVSSTTPSGTATWGCYNFANEFDNVFGSFGLVMEDGRPALHFMRAGSDQHGETGCSTAFTSGGGAGVDVSGYPYLALEASFRIDRQSINACGDVASECAMMLQLDYIPVNQDRAVSWHHGFYLWSADPSTRTRCETCTQEHEIVNTGMWFRYRSDNLFAQFSADRRPERILALRIYSSGHEFDAYVSDVSVLANTQIDPIPVGDPSLQG